LASRFSAVARRKEVLHAAQAKAVQIGIPVIIAVVDGGGYPWSSETDTGRSAGRPESARSSPEAGLDGGPAAPLPDREASPMTGTLDDWATLPGYSSAACG